MLSAYSGQNTLSSGDNYSPPGDRNRNYKQLFRAGQKIGRWMKRKFDQKKARENKVASRRALPRRTLNGYQADGQGDETTSFTRCGRRASRWVQDAKKRHGVGNVFRITGDAYLCASNQQNVAPIGNYMDATDLTNLYTSIGLTAAGYAASKLLLLDVHSESMITNACNSHIHATIYDVVAKLDGFTTVNTGPVTAFTLGFADGDTGAAADYLIPGASPYNNPRFMAGYKILKQTKVVLKAGQTHVHTVQYDINRVVSKERLTLNGVGPVADLTVYSIVVFHGTPYHDAATELVVGTAPVKIDTVKKDTIRYCFLQMSFPVIDYTNQLSTVTSGEQWVENAPADTTIIS